MTDDRLANAPCAREDRSIRKVSIALATYNGAPFLEQQLRTISEQTHPPHELVVCDDCSSDDTMPLLQEFADKAHFRVRLFRNSSQLGYARNFRRAASLCEGDLIAFADQDDFWDEEKIARMNICFDDPQVMLAFHNARIVDIDRIGNSQLYSGALECERLSASPFSPWHHSYGMTQVFRSDLRRFDEFWNLSLNDVADPLDIMSHDQWYFFLASLIGKVLFVDSVLVDYRQHASNSVGANPRNTRFAQKILGRLEHYGRQDQRGAEAALARATIARAIALDHPSLKERACWIASKYEGLATKLERRAAAYMEHSLADRMQAMIRSVSNGDYGDWPWGFKKASIVRDLLFGVFLGRAYEQKWS